MQHLTSRLIALAVFAIALVTSTRARAEAPLALPVDVTRVIESSYAWLEARATGASTTQPTGALSLRTNVSADKPPVDPNAPVLNPPIRLSLVARDWGQSFGLAGRKLVLDDVRLSRSSRMLVGRARVDLGKFQPFVHVGMGEWRYDPTLLPFLPANQELASQLAAGFELRIAKYVRFAVEADYTLLVREYREPQNHPEPRVLGAMAVVHARF